MTTTRTLIGTVTNRAIESFGEWTIERQREWEIHWLATADLLLKEFEDEGLMETHAALTKSVESIKGEMIYG
jgi:hypothetical protein